MNKEIDLKTALKIRGTAHARKIIKKLTAGGVKLPDLAHDSIRQEFEYAILDGYRITMQYQQPVKETENEQDDPNTRFNR